VRLAKGQTALALDDMRAQSWLDLQHKLASPTTTAQPAPKIRQVVFVDPISQHLLALAQGLSLGAAIEAVDRRRIAGLVCGHGAPIQSKTARRKGRAVKKRK